MAADMRLWEMFGGSIEAVTFSWRARDAVVAAVAKV
jgi:hypothetical protein